MNSSIANLNKPRNRCPHSNPSLRNYMGTRCGSANYDTSAIGIPSGLPPVSGIPGISGLSGLSGLAGSWEIDTYWDPLYTPNPKSLFDSGYAKAEAEFEVEVEAEAEFDVEAEAEAEGVVKPTVYEENYGKACHMNEPCYGNNFCGLHNSPAFSTNGIYPNHIMGQPKKISMDQKSGMGIPKAVAEKIKMVEDKIEGYANIYGIHGYNADLRREKRRDLYDTLKFYGVEDPNSIISIVEIDYPEEKQVGGAKQGTTFDTFTMVLLAVLALVFLWKFSSRY